MSMDEFTDTIMIAGEECLYNPTAKLALIQCENCGHMNQVEVEIEKGEPVFMGFSCENCGYWNGAQ